MKIRLLNSAILHGNFLRSHGTQTIYNSAFHLCMPGLGLDLQAFFDGKFLIDSIYVQLVGRHQITPFPATCYQCTVESIELVLDALGQKKITWFGEYPCKTNSAGPGSFHWCRLTVLNPAHCR